MKNILISLVALSVSLFVFLIFPQEMLYANPNNITIVVNGSEVPLSAEMGWPRIENDRTFVPLRLVSEALGVTVNWHASEQRISMRSREGTTLNHILGSNIVRQGLTGPVVSELEVNSFLDASVGRTLVPLRLMAEAFGANIRWILILSLMAEPLMLFGLNLI